MELYTDDKNKMISNLNGIKLENQVCTFEGTQKLQPEDRSYENKSKVLSPKTLKHQRFNKMIRKPNEEQLNHLHFHFHNYSRDSAEFLLNSINAKRGGNDEWTMTNLFATYHLLVLGFELVETRKYVSRKPFALDQIKLYVNPEERYLNSVVRKPNFDQLEYFRTHFKSKSRKNTAEKFLIHINTERDSDETEWSLDNLFATYELLVMGSRFSRGIQDELTNEYKQAESEITQFNIFRGRVNHSDIRNRPAITNQYPVPINSSSTSQVDRSAGSVHHQAQYMSSAQQSIPLQSQYPFAQQSNAGIQNNEHYQ